MRITKPLALFFMLSLAVVGLAGAAGIGTFTIEQTKSADVGQIGIATLYVDNTWQPLADDVWVKVSWDGAVLGYVSADWKVGTSRDAQLTDNELFIKVADWTNKFENGKIAIVDLYFQGKTQGSSPMTITVDHVRSHEGTSTAIAADLTQSAVATPGTFTVAAGNGGVVPT
ncbi:MAG: hypothetical protein GXY82_06745, partial [Methanospirillum sp.]|nr:hypothetical protein [Methanospirillum sp.]